MTQPTRPALALALACAVSLFATPGFAAAPWWTEASPTVAPAKAAQEIALAYRSYEINANELRAQLAAAPRAYAGNANAIEVAFPTADGGSQRFLVVETQVMSPELAAERPDWKTYRGVGIDDSRARIYFDVTPMAVNARVRTINGSWNLGKLPGQDASTLLAWNDSDAQPRAYNCGFDSEGLGLEIQPTEDLGLYRRLGTVMRTYRFAMTTPGEMTVAAGGIPEAENLILTLTNQINSLYELELALTLQIVDFNVYDDPATDPFANGDQLDSTLLFTNNNVLNAKLGNNGYDLGHIVSINTANPQGGLAFLNGPCSSAIQGAGGTLMGFALAGALYPIAIHELGHQLGAPHSFNGTSAGCLGNRTASSAYEIGSGVTIMSYAGLCGQENVLGDDIDMFNAGSLNQITSLINSRPSCGTTVVNGNSVPVISVGTFLTIPRETAFELIGTATDADGDAMTFSWEQYDLGVASPPVNPASGPLFRNFEHSPDPNRSLPVYGLYRNGGITPWEFLPTVDRFMRFRFVVRDNNPAGGATIWAEKTVAVSGAPFAVTSPNGGETMVAGDPMTVTWDIGGGSVASDVRILTSTDRGVSWVEAIASTPNDGSEVIDAPCEASTGARVRIEAVGNIFFDLTDQDFTTTPETTPPALTCPVGFVVTTTDAAGILNTDPALQDFVDAIVVVDNCDADPPVTVLFPPTLPIGDTVVAVTSTDASGNLGFCSATITVELGTSSPAASGRTGIASVYPNPFNPRTTVKFNLSREQNVRLEVFDSRGRRVTTLSEGHREAGEYEVVWSGKNDAGLEVPSGVYFMHMSTEDGDFTERAVLLK